MGLGDEVTHVVLHIFFLAFKDMSQLGFSVPITSEQKGVSENG